MTGIALSQRFFSRKRKWSRGWNSVAWTDRIVNLPSLEFTAAYSTQSDGIHHLRECIIWHDSRPHCSCTDLMQELLVCYSCNTWWLHSVEPHIPAPLPHPNHRTEPCQPQRWFARSRTPGSLWSKTDKFRLSKISMTLVLFASALRRSSFVGGNIPEMSWKRSQHQKLCGVTAFSDKRNSWFLSAVSNAPDLLPSANQFLYHFCFYCTKKRGIHACPLSALTSL